MIQEQLVDYISSQMKAGTPRDTIKNTLVTAGWQSADVEDTLQKAEAAAKAAAPAGAMAGGAKPAAQTMKMSDLISTSEPAAAASAAPATSQTPNKVFTGSKTMDTKAVTASSSAKEFPEKPRSSHGALITEIVLGLLVVGIGAFAGYLYFKNDSLNSQIASLTTASTGNASQLSALQQSFDASTTAMNAQVADAESESTELQTELSFYAASPDSSSTATTTATVGGMLGGGGKVPYVITAKYGAKVYVSNSKDAGVIAVLAPLEASSTSGQFTGSYLPGSDSITLTAVNGTSL